MSNEKYIVKTGGGVSVLSALGLIFVTLKLCGVIDWSWLWVTVPFWGPLALVAAIFICLGVFIVMTALVLWLIEMRRRPNG